jgi:rhodanese-related sulfurtransferase
MRIGKSSLIAALLVSAWLSLSPSVYANEEAAVKAMEDYLEFVDYMGGTILPRQISKEDWKDYHVIDTRDAGQYTKDHIPGAVNIEWRQVLARRNELPKGKMILLYCNGGTLSSQAAFALKVAGVENILILQGGFDQWKKEGGFEASRRGAPSAKH